jgi:hypothetical protein
LCQKIGTNMIFWHIFVFFCHTLPMPLVMPGPHLAGEPDKARIGPKYEIPANMLPFPIK